MRGGMMAKLCVVGSGVVGQATGKGFLNHGHDVTFVDVNRDTVEQLQNEGFKAILPEAMSLDGVDAVFISVSTPTEEDGIKLSFLDRVSRDIGLLLTNSQSRPIIVFRSTMPPGTTSKRLIPILEKSAGNKVGYLVCYNPEYLRAHAAERDFERPRIITIGCDASNSVAGDKLEKLYLSFDAPIYRCTYEEAEFQKYVHNLFNAAKISFFNEMREIAKSLDIDPTLAFQLAAFSAQGMWDPLYGTHDRGPYAGACLPKDTNAWIKYMEDLGYDPIFMRAVREINRSIGGE